MRGEVKRLARATWRGTVYRPGTRTPVYVTLRGTQQQAMYDVCRTLALLGTRPRRRWWRR